ncbi:MAG: hypothetical protein H0W40_09020 [Methylibium sp.]|uniref:hypothetical protein n=1 Tax=Methylibium sp. TaxID=2067992 RepID=UPI0017F60DDA|nr:hypothetical protein [Methylibium sp.]MBA3597507.1 hypothetical protein [Methylibium sp.]
MAAATTNNEPRNTAVAREEAQAEAKTEPTPPRNYDEAAVTRLVRRGILEVVKEGPPQFDLTVPCVRRM